MYIGNILLLIMSIPLVGIFVKILRVRAAILAPITALITLLGAYTINNSMFDVMLVVVFGIVGYLMKKFGFEPGPLVLAFVLGALLESSLRRSLLVFDGDPRASSAGRSPPRCWWSSSWWPCCRASGRMLAKRKAAAPRTAHTTKIKEKV